MDMIFRNAYVSTGSLGFTFSNQSFDGTDFWCIDLTGFFIADEFARFFHDLRGPAFIDTKDFVETHGKINKPEYKLIVHRYIARGLVSHMHIVSLFVQANESSAH